MIILNKIFFECKLHIYKHGFIKELKKSFSSLGRKFM